MRHWPVLAVIEAAIGRKLNCARGDSRPIVLALTSWDIYVRRSRAGVSPRSSLEVDQLTWVRTGDSYITFNVLMLSVMLIVICFH